MDDDDRIERLEAIIVDQGQRIVALEKWQAFIMGVYAAAGAVVGVGLTLASLLLK